MTLSPDLHQRLIAYLSQHADTLDGGDGRAQPNEAMMLKMELEREQLPASIVADSWAEGPDGWKDVCTYINETPALLSLLYDIDLLPEQHPDHDSRAWADIFTIALHWRAALAAAREQGRDGERYRWLRQKSSGQALMKKKYAGQIQVIRWDDKTEASSLKFGELDAAIDAAMQQAGEVPK